MNECPEKYMKKIVISVLLLGIVAGILWFWLGNTDDKKIRKQFARLAENVTKEPKEGNISMVCKMQGLGTLFANSCDIDIPKSHFSGTYSPEEIVSNTTRGRIRFSSLKLEFYDIKINITGENTASVVFTGRLSGIVNNDKSDDEIRELDAAMEKVDGKWLFSSFKVVEVLEK